MAPDRKIPTLAVFILLAGCSTTPQGLPVLNTNPNSNAAAPSSDLASPPGAAASSTDLTGNYTGTISSPLQAGYCSGSGPVTNFRVDGNNVVFGEFRGTIRPDGYLQMVFGRNWVTGNFSGPHFTGRYTNPRCEGDMTLDRTG